MTKTVRHPSNSSAHEPLTDASGLRADSPEKSLVSRGSDRRASDSVPAFPLQRTDGSVLQDDARSGVDRRTLGFISTFRIFRGVAYASVEKIVARCELRDFSESQVLLNKGQVNTSVALVIHGRVRVHLDAPDSSDFFEIVQGECVGEMSVIDGRPVSAYVVADAGCRLLMMDAQTFLSEVLIVPGVARNLMTVFAERMRSNNTRITERMKAAMELERLQRELHFARDMQEGMLPQGSPLFPERTDLWCGGKMRAAREVGGDFYDAFFIDADRLFVAIGDICGKGMPAALLMARTMTLLRSEATRRVRSQRNHVQDIMERVNRGLSDNNPSFYFASIFAAILHTSTGVLTYVNAGHNPPLIAGPGMPFSYEPETRSPVAGVVPDTRYRAVDVAFPAGATLVAYTDGVTEAENAQSELWGEERLLATLNGLRGGEASALTDAVLSAVDGFTQGHPQSDDITLLVLHSRA
jgi:sigma-B regulation protein RsbU (phosphoserine phosphatase)